MPSTGMSMSLEDLIAAFDSCEDWEERYELLIDLGKEVPPMPSDEMIEKNRVQGCQSAVWLTARKTGAPPIVELTAQSDSQIVRGLVFVMLTAYNGRPPQEILEFDIRGLFQRLGFTKHLSQSRTNGLFSMVKRVQEFARQCSHHAPRDESGCAGC